MADNKEKTVSPLQGLKKVKCTRPAAENKQGGELAFNFYVDSSKSAGFRRNKRRPVSFFEFRASPLTFLKQFPTMQVHTNATDAQMELIAKTSITKLQEISNGK